MGSPLPKRIDATLIRAQVDWLRASHPDLWTGEDAVLADMLELDTDLHAFLAAVVREIHEAELMIAGLDQLLGVYGKRRDRYEGRYLALRTLALKMLAWADVKKIELPAATLSMRAGTPKVIITDEAALPVELTRVVSSPDKAAIKDALLRGETVPGAMLSNAEPTLALRVK